MWVDIYIGFLLFKSHLPFRMILSPLGISGDHAGLINSSPMPGKFKLNYSYTRRKSGCWFSAKSKGLKYQDWGIKNQKNARIWEVQSLWVKDLEMAQSNLADVSPSLQPVADGWAVSLSSVTTDKHLLVCATSQSSIRCQIAKAYSSYQAESFYNFILWTQFCPQNKQQKKMKTNPSTPSQPDGIVDHIFHILSEISPDQTSLNISSEILIICHWDPTQCWRPFLWTHCSFSISILKYHPPERSQVYR